jgi:PAS domain S-box-containing protein
MPFESAASEGLSIENLFEAIGDMAYEFDSRGICLRYLGPAGKAFGPPESLRGKRLDEVLPQEVAEPLFEAITRAIREKALQTLEYSLSYEEGPRRHEARIVPFGKTRVWAVVRDIEARRRAEAEVPRTRERIRESEARFRTMADSAPVLLWMAGVDAECNFFNRGWLEFTGRTMDAEMGVGWAEGVYFEDFQNCMQVYLTSFSTRKSFRMEYRMRRADGEFRWVLDTGVPRFGVDGSFEGFIGSCIDITDIREANEALSKSAGELERRVRDRNRELEASNRELERFNRLMVNRELKMIELKKQVNALSAELGRPEPYKVEAEASIGRAAGGRTGS